MGLNQHVDDIDPVELLPQLLQQLYPVAIEAFKQYTDGRTVATASQMYAGDERSDRLPETMAGCMMDQWLTATGALLQNADDEQIAASIRQNPLITLKALEAAVRGAPIAALCLPALRAFDVASSVLMALPYVVKSYTADAAADALSSLEDAEVQKLALSLLNSCFKAANSCPNK